MLFLVVQLSLSLSLSTLFIEGQNDPSTLEKKGSRQNSYQPALRRQICFTLTITQNLLMVRGKRQGYTLKLNISVLDFQGHELHSGGSSEVG